MRVHGRLIVLVVASTFLLSSCSLWTQFGFGPDHTGSNPRETVLTTANVATLTTKWTTPAGNLEFTSPMEFNNTVYFGSTALNATTGAVLWTGGLAAPYSSAYGSGLVYEVYFALHSSVVSAVDPTTGNDVWVSAGSGNQVFYTPVTLSGGAVYVGRTDGKVYALDALTGAVLWSTQTTGSSGQPAVLDGVVYVGSGSDLDALDAATGAVLWTSTLGASGNSTPTIVNGVVYVGSEGNVYALNAGTGAGMWTTSIGGAGAGLNITSSTAVTGGVVYVGSADHNVYALNAATGAVLWTRATGGVVDGSPSVANGVVYIQSEDGNLYALNATTGAVLFTAAVGRGNSTPAVVDGVVYAGGGGNVYAFGLPAAP